MYYTAWCAVGMVDRGQRTVVVRMVWEFGVGMVQTLVLEIMRMVGMAIAVV